MAPPKVVGDCICPICYDLHGIESEPWRGELHRARIHAPPSKPYLELHCPICLSKTRGRALWLWLNNPKSLTTWNSKAPSVEQRKKRMAEDVTWASKRAKQDQESFRRLRLAGLRGDDDLYCPVCQRLESAQKDGPMLWLAHHPTKDALGKCRRCMTLYYGNEEIITWRKFQLTDS